MLSKAPFIERDMPAHVQLAVDGAATHHDTNTQTAPEEISSGKAKTAFLQPHTI